MPCCAWCQSSQTGNQAKLASKSNWHPGTVAKSSPAVRVRSALFGAAAPTFLEASMAYAPAPGPPSEGDAPVLREAPVPVAAPIAPHLSHAAPLNVPSVGAAPAAQSASKTPEEWAIAMDQALQRTLDKLAPHQLYRWLGLGTSLPLVFLAFLTCHVRPFCQCQLLLLMPDAPSFGANQPRANLLPVFFFCWLVGVLMMLFFLRMFLIHGFYIVTYVLLIFILNQFILFLQPKDRASLIAARTNSSDGDGNGESAPAALPTLDAEEFRPFVRRLPEFHFWYSSTVATTMSICATFFPVFDVPVFWPVLVFYFILLFVMTMRRQWLDMKRLKYVPWDIGNKKTYKSDPKRVSVKKENSSRAGAASAMAAATPLAGPDASAPPVPTVKRAPPPVKQPQS